MYKKIVMLIFIFALFIPFRVLADEVTSTNLLETLDSEEIDYDKDTEYKDSTEKVNVYLFRGSGCTYCKSFLNYLSIIIE